MELEANSNDVALTGKENLLDVYGLLEEFYRLRKIDRGLPIERDKLISLKRKYFEPRNSNKIPYTGLKALAVEALSQTSNDPIMIGSTYLKPLSEKDLQEGFVLTDVPVPKKRKKEKKKVSK